MRDSCYISGCKSGVQKAIRRSDLDLARTCIDGLWPELETRHWLRWRTPILVAEESWYMLGELAKFIDMRSDSDDFGELEEKQWRKFLYQVTLAPKSKDAWALLWLARYTERQEDEHTELDQMRLWWSMVTDDDPTSIVDDMVADFEQEAEFTPYEIRAIEIVRARMLLGGMLGDRQALLAVLLLIYTRRLRPPSVKKRMDEGFQLYLSNSPRKPRTVNLPWFAMDTHTKAGRMALSAFHKRYAPDWLSKDDAGLVWFLATSSHVPVGHAHWTAPKAAPKPWESMWWPIYLRTRLQALAEAKDVSVADLMAWWGNTCAPRLEELVAWALEKLAA